MKVTGNTLIAFEKWYCKKHKKTFSLNYLKMIIEFFGSGKNAHLKAFECSPDDMKIGVFISFFDSVGIYFEDNLGLNEGIFGFMIHSGKGIEGYNFLVSSEPFTTRNESNTAAVEKADKLFNARSEAIDTNNI